MRAILRYTNCLQDGKRVFYVLAGQHIEIIKTKVRPFNIYPEITVLVEDHSQLNKLLKELNQVCNYEVCLVKTCKSIKCDSCKQRECCSAVKKNFHTIIDFLKSLAKNKCE